MACKGEFHPFLSNGGRHHLVLGHGLLIPPLRKYARHSVVPANDAHEGVATRTAANGHELSYTIASTVLTPVFPDGFVASSVIRRRWLQPREKGNRGWNFLVNLVDGFRGVGFRTLWESWENFCERSRGWLTINKGHSTRFASFKRLWNCKKF